MGYVTEYVMVDGKNIAKIKNEVEHKRIWRRNLKMREILTDRERYE